MAGRIVVVSTYPDRGTRNIGDGLIGRSVEAAIKDASAGSVEVRQVFRGESWSQAKFEIDWADHVVFACLAIRNNLSSKTYPYLRELLDTGKPYSVLAAGTDLPVKSSSDFRQAIDSDSSRILREVGENASLFTTRGLLTQKFCRAIGINKSEFGGDVAFYYPSKYGQEFRYDASIRRIVVSDPHRADRYHDSFEWLIDGLKALFPVAKITVALHGVNEAIEDFCFRMDVEFVRIYEDASSGLSIYDNCDMHVGYRVHGHVSALSRRVYSYLMEQDGRGADYGLTLSRKIGVSHFLQPVELPDGRRALMGSVSAPQQVLGLIEGDLNAKFARFVGFGNEIEQYSRATEAYISRIVQSM